MDKEFNQKNNKPVPRSNKVECKWVKWSMILTMICIWSVGCKQQDQTKPSTYAYIAPEYGQIGLQLTNDTLHFPLNEDAYNEIKSFNMFSWKGIDYIAFYDNRSGSINIYDFHLQKPVKKILLKKAFKGKKLFKTTTYVKSFDSIYVNNWKTLYLLNSNGRISKKIDFLSKPKLAWPHFENANMPVFKDGLVFAGVRPYAKTSSLKAMRKWKVLYAFDMQNEKAALHYNLPELYRENIYGYHFLDYNYCYNDKGKFVFSFPADSNIYETNLADYHMSYYAKSKFQSAPITPVPKEELKENGSREYAIRDSYGPIFFDPVRNRYLRHAKQRINEADYKSKKNSRTESVIIFDSGFKVIGELRIPDELSFKTLFFTRDGKMYTRVNVRDEYVLHFVEVVYNEEEGNRRHLTQNQSTAR